MSADSPSGSTGKPSWSEREELIRHLQAENTRLRGLVEEARPCVVSALNCPSHPWHGSDMARSWLVRGTSQP